MLKILKNAIEGQLTQRVPATGLAFFRIAFSLVALQEVIFLFYFRHLIFDPLPYLDRASPVLHVLLMAWMVILIFMTIGYHTRRCAVMNYLFWVVFVIFTPMWQDFDGGFDQLMTGSSLLLIFLPSERAFSLDRLRWAIRFSVPGKPYAAPHDVPRLAYTLPLAMSLGLVYFDSGLHKVSSEFWRNGMGAWLPPTMPYYMSPLDLSPLLNLRWLETGLGYTVMGFQLVFLFLFWFKPWRVPLLILGSSFHLGIILALNVYPFGFAMLVHYLLLVPFGGWRTFARWITVDSPGLRVFYDEGCPLCTLTVSVLQHLDIRHGVTFLGLQSGAGKAPELSEIQEERLLKDLYSVDKGGKVRCGIDTYIALLEHLGWSAPVGWLLRIPGIYHLARRRYRVIADQRARVICGDHCTPLAALDLMAEHPLSNLLKRDATDRQRAFRISKLLVLVLVLQLNSTVHYGILYRWAGTRPSDPLLAVIDQASDSLINLSHAFLGISPHALYLHDHFDHYNQIVALTYKAPSGEETWLPFINQEGRLLSPNWGRIQSMWANVAITSHMSLDRLEKFSKKITAFYAPRLGIPLNDARFIIKSKQVEVPTDWSYDLRHRNMATGWEDIGELQWHEGTARLERMVKPSSQAHDPQDRPDATVKSLR